MNRVLRLPVFSNMSEELYDMLVGHEVAHALYTPFTEEDQKSLKDKGFLSCALKIADGDVSAAPIAHSYMNVVEDARIERMIKDKFAGLRRDFFIAYKELSDRDFFKVKKKKIADMSFIDRINLYFKIGSHITVTFTDEEMEYVKMVEGTSTFDDVINVTKKIWDYCKDKNSMTSDSDITLVSVKNSDNDNEGKNGEDELDGDGKKISNTGDWHSRSIMPDQCLTQQSFDTSLSNNLIEKDRHNSQSYYTLPDFREESIIDYKTLLGLFDVCASRHTNAYHNINVKSKKFIEESNRVVNILAQEFFARKAATDHHRSAINRTGVIDTVRMMNYKFTDDIFNRVKVTKKGKSHGLVFFVDMSGSMSPVLDDTYKQMIQLALFCKRVNIPFEVYGFTTKNIEGDECDRYFIDENQEKTYKSLYDKCWKTNDSKYNTTDLDPVCAFTLVNLLSSRMSKREMELGIRNIIATGSYYKRDGGQYEVPSIMHLSSTPLIESIVAAMDIVPKFKERNRLDIVHSVFLTDGEPTGVNISIGNTHCFKNGILYKMNHKKNIESNMINMFKQVTGMKAICFFLCDQKSSLPMGPFGSWYVREQDALSVAYEKQNKNYIKENWATAYPSAHCYDEKFIIKANVSVEYGDLDEILSGKTSNVGIRNGFIKAMNEKIVSRVLLNRFISLIATE